MSHKVVKDNFNNMISKENTQKIISYLDEADIDKVFDCLDNLGIEDYELSRLKKEFIHGKTDFEFEKRLRTYIKELGKPFFLRKKGLAFLLITSVLGSFIFYWLYVNTTLKPETNTANSATTFNIQLFVNPNLSDAIILIDGQEANIIENNLTVKTIEVKKTNKVHAVQIIYEADSCKHISFGEKTEKIYYTSCF